MITVNLAALIFICGLKKVKSSHFYSVSHSLIRTQAHTHTPVAQLDSFKLFMLLDYISIFHLPVETVICNLETGNNEE